MTEPLSVAVVGSGRAAAARVRALDGHSGAELVAQVSRGPAEKPATLESVLGNAAIDALVVCTPNALHAAVVGRALEAGKHVAVEYPLALTAEEGRALFALARERERVLHVEHIELLSPSQRALREAAAAAGPLVSGRVHFRGTLGGWLGDEALSGPPAVRALARLHRITDLFGESRVRAARLDRQPDRESLEVEFAFASGGRLTLLEEWGAELARATDWEIECEDGPLEPRPADAPRGLFDEDTRCFLGRIEDGTASYVSESRILRVLELAASITVAAGSGN